MSDVVGIGVGIVCDVPASNSKMKRRMKSKIDRKVACVMCNTGTSFDIKVNIRHKWIPWSSDREGRIIEAYTNTSDTYGLPEY